LGCEDSDTLSLIAEQVSQLTLLSMNVYNSANTNNNQTDLTSASVLAQKVSVVRRIRPLRVGIERYLLHWAHCSGGPSP